MRLVSDTAWAALTIWQESRGESYFGKLAVAEVIRNRMQRKYQSDGTVVGTVLRPYQFGWNTKDHNRVLAAQLDDGDEVVRECIQAWTEATTQDSNIALKALLYYNPAAVRETPPWVGACRKVATIGAHHFYVPGAV